MKRNFLLLLVVSCLVASVSAQSFVIYKSDGSFTDISANEVDSIVFAPQAAAGFGKASFANIGIDKLAQEKIEHYFAESRKYLDKVSVTDERKQVLVEYTNRMMHREY